MLAGCASGVLGPVTVNGGGWKATFPTTPTEHTQQVHGATVTTWEAARGAETDAVSVSPAVGLQAAVEGSAAAIGGDVVAHNGLRWLGGQAEDAVIATTDRLVRERALVAGGRLYVLEGISRSAPPAFPGFDALVASFRLEPSG